MVYVPDANFRSKLIALGYGSCFVGDSINSNCALIINATDLPISGSNINSIEGIQAFVNLISLNCSYNPITSLPALPNSLIALNCNKCTIIGFSVLPNSLMYLDCYGMGLNNLPILPNNLTRLGCGGNSLTSLPSLPSSLVRLSCTRNHLVNLPSLNSLQYLDCSFNQITSLPSLPNSLTYLDCSVNQLSSLPPLGALVELRCSNNQLTSLPTLPSSLAYLWCAYNHLPNIPTLPNLLWDLDCSTNQVTSLPILPSSLLFLNCRYNQITTLPELPESLRKLDCSYNNNLTCLPRLKQLDQLSFLNTGITCLPNYGNIATSTPPLSNFPICGLYNSNGCNSYWNISGKAYFEDSPNCLFDLEDIRQSNEHIMLFKDGILQQQIFTRGEGFYSFDLLDTGNYSVQIDTSDLSFQLFCPINNSFNDTITSTDSLFYDNDFSLICKQNFDVGCWSISAIGFRSGRQTFLNLQVGDIANFYGVHCANGVSGSVTIILDGPISYVSPAVGALLPTSIMGDTIIYTVADFGAINMSTAFNMIVLTDQSAVIGRPVCITVSVLPIVGDNNSANNVLTHCFAVRASFDPNEKEVYPDGDIEESGDRWLTYTIHFQNTGTAPAEHIYITDTLNQNLDLSTFRLLAYSYQPFVQILEGGIAKFNFPNINLIDSTTDEPMSHGYVQYKIKLKNSSGVGAQIRNTAYIYFDFNSPVKTNTTLNTITTATGIASLSNLESSIEVFPNPSKNEFTVFDSRFSMGKKISLKLFDALGKEVLSEMMRSSRYQLHTSDLHSGIYFLKIESENGVVMKKLVKQ